MTAGDLRMRLADETFTDGDFATVREAWNKHVPGDISDTGAIALAFARADEEIASAAAMLAANEAGCTCAGDAPPEPGESQREEARLTLRKRAIALALFRIEAQIARE